MRAGDHDGHDGHDHDDHHDDHHDYDDDTRSVEGAKAIVQLRSS